MKYMMIDWIVINEFHLKLIWYTQLKVHSLKNKNTFYSSFSIQMWLIPCASNISLNVSADMLHFHLSIFLRLAASPDFAIPLIKFFAPSSSPCSELMTHSSRFRCSTLNSSLLKSASYDTVRSLFANEISWVICLALFTISSRSVPVTLKLCMSICSEMRGNTATMLFTYSPSSSLNSETESTTSKFSTRPLISCLIHHLSRSLISWQSSGSEYTQILTIDWGSTYCPTIFLTNLRVHESDRSRSSTSLPTIVLPLFMTPLVWSARLLSSATEIAILLISGSSSGFGLRSSSLGPSWDTWWTSSGVSILMTWLGSSAASTVLCKCCVSVSTQLFCFWLLSFVPNFSMIKTLSSFVNLLLILLWSWFSSIPILQTISKFFWEPYFITLSSILSSAFW